MFFRPTGSKLRLCVTGKFTLFRVTRNSGIPEFRLTELNCTSKTPELRGNLMEILTEMLYGNGTGNKYGISVINGITGFNPEITKRTGNSHQNLVKFQNTYILKMH